MLTEGHEERRAFEDQMRQYMPAYAKGKSRHDLIKMNKAEFLDSALRERFERVLAAWKKHADEFACDAGEEANAFASRPELDLVACEVAYMEASVEAMPMLMATALAKSGALVIAA